MRQKHHWDKRIQELGGRTITGRQLYDVEGVELPGAKGYRYYGAAKELPGVREIFAEERDELQKYKKKRTRTDMYKNITPDYYGYRDEDDGVILIKENEMEVIYLFYKFIINIKFLIFNFYYYILLHRKY
jgi:pre-mRNA-splicing factor ISY1